MCKPRFIDGVPYYDGALGNPVPIEKAFQDDCDKVVLILTKPVDEILTPDTDEKPLRQRLPGWYGNSWIYVNLKAYLGAAGLHNFDLKPISCAKGVSYRYIFKELSQPQPIILVRNLSL